MINGTQVNVEELVNFLRNRTDITGLNLCMVEIGAEGAEALANGNLSNLTSLNLTWNNIGDEGAREFVKLKDLGLDLSGNNISELVISV